MTTSHHHEHALPMTETPEGLLWVVVERSGVGDTTVGVFTTLEQARETVRELAGDRLEAYRIEGHALDQPRSEAIPWHVSMTRAGEVVSATPFIGCSCQDDEAEYYKHSVIEAGGESMQVMAFATTPGQAIATADDYRVWLQDNGYWDTAGRQLSPIHARTRMEPGL